MRYGLRLRCVERDSLCSLSPADACRGCWFSTARKDDSIVNCVDIQCSSFDRMDGRNVWFVSEG